MATEDGCRVGILGPLQVTCGSVAVEITAPKARGLLVLLALRAGHPVSADELIDGLWGDSPPKSAAKTLQTYVVDLRRVLPAGAVRTTPGGYQLELESDGLDAARFERAVSSSRQVRHSDPVRAAEELADGLRLWRGPALVDVAVQLAGMAAGQRLDELRRAATEDLAELRLRAGGHHDVVADLEAAVSAEPLRERRWAQLMLALYRCGRQADALRAYRRLSVVLGEDLGIEPSAELTQLEQAILLQRPELDWRATDRPPDGGAKGPESGDPIADTVGPGPGDALVTLMLADLVDPDGFPVVAGGAALPETPVRDIVAAHHGTVLSVTDGLTRASFDSAADAVVAATVIQQRLAGEPWTARGIRGARIALHTGSRDRRGGDFVGPTAERAAQLLVAAHAGQTALFGLTADIVGDRLPEGALLRDLGEHRLRDLERPERIFDLELSGLDSGFPPLRSLDDPRLLHNIPVQATSFIGRSRELAQITSLLQTARMVTCTGPGGVGKTRLAIQAASTLLDGTGSGVWVVELAPVADPALVPAAVAEAIGLREEPGRPVIERLLEALRLSRMLIVLDNCEHLIDACAQLAHTLLRRCEHVHLLATSREPLRVDGEHVFAVPSLSLPAHDVTSPGADLIEYEAVRLFAERAGMHRRGFVLDETNAGSVLAICRRVDGIPLAIELATARLRSLSVSEIESRLQDRFRLLKGGSRSALPRQQTLRALIDWSYDLLSEPERIVLRRAAVFTGGFDLEAAEAVISHRDVDPSDVVDLVTSLADKSLIQVDPAAELVRYRLSETVRQYGLERLAEAGELEVAATNAAHAEAFVNLAERVSDQLEGPNQLEWLRRLDADHDNLRAAFAYLLAAEGRHHDALRLAAGLHLYWNIQAYNLEGIDMLEAALSQPGIADETPARATALMAFAHLQIAGGDRAAGQRRAAESLVMARQLDDPALVVRCLVVTSFYHTLRGESGRSQSIADEAVTLAEEAGMDRRLAQALGARSMARWHAGQEVIGRSDSDRAFRLWMKAGNRISAVTALNNTACMEIDIGINEDAEQHAQEAYDLAVALNLPGDLPYVCATLALVHLLRGRPDVAQNLARDAIVVIRRTGDRAIIATSVLLLALASSALGRLETAALLHGAADACLMEGDTYDPVETRLSEKDRSRLQADIGVAAYQDAYAAGHQLGSGEDVLEYLSSHADSLT